MQLDDILVDICQRIEKEMQNNQGYLNILIAGCTCSGKTTLAKILKEALASKYAVSIISQDNYFKDLVRIPRSRMGYLMDSPNAFEGHEFEQDCRLLLANGFVWVPRYDIKQNKRVAKDIYVTKGQINIFEGLHVIRFLSDLPNNFTIYLNTPFDVCLERRIKRDVASYGISEQIIRGCFSSCILPLSKDYILPQKDKADIVLSCEREDAKCRCLLKK